MAAAASYTPNYFSLNDILCTEERISCKVEVEMPGLGFLDPSSESEDLKTGSKLELPLWLAESLNSMQGTTIVSVDIPNIYKEGYREILEADARAVVLGKWNPHYYELGMHLRKLDARDCEKITESLMQTFTSRFGSLMDRARNPISDPGLPGRLPRLERELFLIGRKAEVRSIDWLERGTGSIQSSEVATNIRKRKRTTDYDLDDEYPAGKSAARRFLTASLSDLG